MCHDRFVRCRLNIRGVYEIRIFLYIVIKLLCFEFVNIPKSDILDSVALTASGLTGLAASMGRCESCALVYTSTLPVPKWFREGDHNILSDCILHP